MKKLLALFLILALFLPVLSFAENEGGDGIAKIVVDEGNDAIIGVHMIGSYASEIIYGAAAMIARHERAADVRRLVFPHPTVCEVIREGMFMIK